LSSRTVLVREEALLQAADEDRVEFQALGGMHGHQLQGVVAFAGLVLAGFERGVRQEGGRSPETSPSASTLPFLGDEVLRGVHQLVEVGEAVLALLLAAVVGAQAGKLKHMLDQSPAGSGSQAAFSMRDQRGEGGRLAAALRRGV
jgi:hypothetical protein